MNENQLKHLDEIIKKEYSNIMGIMISREGDLVYEQYFNEFSDSDSIHIASVTKSIVSLLIGIAIDQELIGSVDDYVLDYFPDYILKRGEKKIREVKIKHLLTMTAPYKYRSEPYTKVYSSMDWTKSALDLLGGKGAIGEYKYSTVGMQILSGILVKATGQSVQSFARQNLFNPLGIQTPESKMLEDKESHIAFLRAKKSDGWISDPNGVHTAGWGIALNVGDLHKVGEMCLCEGMYKNKRIVSDKWLKESTKAYSQWEKYSYGYLWWLVNEGYAAIGDGGNVIFVCHSKKVIISIISSFKPQAKDRIELINNYVLPYL